MKSLMSFLAAGSLLLALAACASSASPPPEPSYQLYVVERDLAVHLAANAGADQIGVLPAGSTFSGWLEDVGGNWYRLHSDSGNIGYIFGKPFRPAP